MRPYAHAHRHKIASSINNLSFLEIGTIFRTPIPPTWSKSRQFLSSKPIPMSLTMVLLTASAILGYLAGASLIVTKQCILNPTLCQGNGTYPSKVYYWTRGPRIVVGTGSGQVRGVSWTSRGGRQFLAFLGIPFGEVPMRFEASRPYPRWDGIREASSFGPMCLQLDRKKEIIAGAEDCLFLNVYTPQINENALLPVMVWIDSTLGWQSGCGSKVNPRNFMDEQVILMTFNFRQSSLGFLSTGDGEIQGNVGLKDQVLALMWVRQNIKNFGGDPDRVTIFGSDSGGAAVHLHMLSPMSKGLFHRAISQSGSAHCPWTLQHNSGSKAATLASYLGCDHPTTKELVDCLRFKSGEEILLAEMKMKPPHWTGEPYALFGPTVEKVAFKSTPFLADTPRAIISTGEFSRVPWIVGWNEEEGRYFVAKVLNSMSLTNEINSKWKSLAPLSFLYDEVLPGPEKDGVSTKLQNFYLGGKAVGRESWENYTKIYTDRYYLAGIEESIRAHSNVSQVYPYVFKFRGDLTTYTPLVAGDYRFKRGPSHFDELYYLFNWEWNMDLPAGNEGNAAWLGSGGGAAQPGISNPYEDISNKIIKSWVSFADTGVPRGWGTNPEWTPINPNDPWINWYALDYDTRNLVDDPSTMGRMDFWKNLNLRDDAAL